MNRLVAAIEFKGAGASTKVANLLMSLHFYSLHDLQAVPWEEQPHVRGLERRLLATSGCGPVMLAQIRNIYFTGHIATSGARGDRESDALHGNPGSAPAGH